VEAAARRRLWPSVGLMLGGLVLSAGYLAIHLLAPAGPRWEMASGALLLFAVALAIAGAVGLVFQLAMGRSYEWLVAWRYLRVQHKRSWTTLVVGIGLLVLAGATYAVSYAWGEPKLEVLGTGPTHLQRYIQTGALVVGAISHWVLFFGFLMLVFSLFTTISVFTVFLGLEALVAVLSMMGGFEYDLRQKILGTTAHVVITRPKAVFGDYRRVLQGAGKIPEVVAAAPFLESEVMMTSQTNLSGVLLRGIDPVLIRKLTDLPRFLKSEGGSGSLENLVHPERLARIPEARFRPLVTAPLGEPPDFAKDKKDNKKKERKAPGEKENKREKARPGPKVGIIGDLDALDDLDDADDEPGVGQKAPPRPLYPGVIIGAELAKNLRLYVGDDVNMVAPLGGMSPAGPIPKSKPFRVAGIFYSGLYEYDNKFAFVTIPAAQRFLGLADEVTGIELKVASLDAAGPAAQRAEEMLAGKGYQVQDWRQRNVNLFSALKLEKLVMFIVLTFIVLVASFSIVTNLNMVVLEKVREIAALKAMGAPNGALLRVFLYAGLYIGIIGMLVGVLGGIGICVFLGNVGLPLDPEIYYISELPVRMDPLEITIVALAGVTLSFLATIYPSLLAARLRPADGLRRHDA
jgi:lipoprotein-releasing system permease protein